MPTKARMNPEEMDQFRGNVAAAVQVIVDKMNEIKECSKSLNECVGGSRGEALNEQLGNIVKIQEPVVEKGERIKAGVIKLIDDMSQIDSIMAKTVDEIAGKVASMKKTIS